MKSALIGLCLLTLGSVALAQDGGAAAAGADAAAMKFRCEFNGMTRRVEVDGTNGQPLPCTVNYYKDTEAPGVVSALWSAQNDANYCADKAQAFVQKLESWGWSCE